jgi:hypothetical protein
LKSNCHVWRLMVELQHTAIWNLAICRKSYARILKAHSHLHSMSGG